MYNPFPDDYINFLDSVPPFSDKMDLIGINNMLNALDNFHDKLCVIHVAGTNGKGSCVAMLESIYRANGYTVGTYISPYIKDYRECIHLNGYIIPHDLMNTSTQAIKTAYKQLAQKKLQLPTQYECLTCIALYAMYLSNVNLAIIETLMGGLNDATNVFKTIEAALITSIGYDHMEFLGDNLIDIATQKAGIIKGNCPVFINPNPTQVVDTIYTYAKKIDAFPYTSSEYIKHHHLDISPFTPLALKGKHQIDNFLGVFSIVSYLQKKYPTQDSRTQVGLSTLKHPCRIETFEYINHKITIDGSHNEEGLTALYHYLKADCPISDPPLLLVFGTLKNKNYQGGLSLLRSLSSQVIITSPDNARALSPEYVANTDDLVITDLYACIDYIKKILKKRTSSCHVVICGSFYVAYPFRQALINH